MLQTVRVAVDIRRRFIFIRTWDSIAHTDQWLPNRSKSAGASKASETNRLRDSQYRGMPTKDGKRDREIMRT
jgi:hypothetical protein